MRRAIVHLAEEIYECANGSDAHAITAYYLVSDPYYPSQPASSTVSRQSGAAEVLVVPDCLFC